MDLLSAVRMPMAAGLVFAVILVGARTSGIVHAQSRRDIARLVAKASIIAIVANIGDDLRRYRLASAAGIKMNLWISVLLRRIVA